MFQIECPNCGTRNVDEFHFGGEQLFRPPERGAGTWTDYLYKRDNTLGVQTEWWFHRLGCRRWFLARRETSSNEVLETFWPHNHARRKTTPRNGSRPL